MTARLLRTGRSVAELPESSRFSRGFRSPERTRPPEFAERFEDLALVYDCFWHADGKRVLLSGPPPLNLLPALRSARYTALPSRRSLGKRYHLSLSVMLTELTGVPPDTTAIVMEAMEERFELPIQPNHSQTFAGSRVLFSMSRNNELDWIAEWARWHARLHGTDAVILFDNGSTDYKVEDVAETLQRIDGLKTVAVPSWPGRFGMTDAVLKVNPYWSHFLQIASMGVVLRRFGAAAFGLLNCDVDELAATHSGKSIYDFLPEARKGLVVFEGRWMEANATPGSMAHRAFAQHHPDPKRSRSGPRKWVLDPRREWVRGLDVHPYWHWVEGRPWFGKTRPADAFYRHFRGINTNWKEDRTRAADSSGLVTDTALVADFARMDADGQPPQH